MQPLTGLTLMMAIQAVHAERKRLRAAVAELARRIKATWRRWKSITSRLRES